MGMDFVVPFAVEFVFLKADRLHFFVGDFSTDGIVLLVQPAMNFQALTGPRGAY